jgi:hypothetical protein
MPSTPLALWVLGICHVLGAFFTLRLLWRSRKDSFNTIFWSILIVILPLIGTFGWFAFEFDFTQPPRR